MPQLVLRGRQPITDQKARYFHTRYHRTPFNRLEVISERARQRSLAERRDCGHQATTKSGLGVKTPMGKRDLVYGSFGTRHSGDSTLAMGGEVGELRFSER